VLKVQGIFLKRRIPKMDIFDTRPGMVEVICRYITKNGKRIYPKNAKYFHFWVDEKDDLVRNPKDS
jgi:hypothetical protein